METWAVFLLLTSWATYKILWWSHSYNYYWYAQVKKSMRYTKNIKGCYHSWTRMNDYNADNETWKRQWICSSYTKTSRINILCINKQHQDQWHSGWFFLMIRIHSYCLRENATWMLLHGTRSTFCTDNHR